MHQTIFVILAVLIWSVVPAALIWGWVRWARHEKPWMTFPILSLTGFALATLSDLLAIAGALYLQRAGDFKLFNRAFIVLWDKGPALSIVGIVFGLAGLGGRSSLRWFAPICAAGALLFWIESLP